VLHHAGKSTNFFLSHCKENYLNLIRQLYILSLYLRIGCKYESSLHFSHSDAWDFKLVSSFSFMILSPGLKIIKLRFETSLKFQASDWLKWRPVAIAANHIQSNRDDSKCLGTARFNRVIAYVESSHFLYFSSTLLHVY
jgi:hypothetical protein